MWSLPGSLPNHHLVKEVEEIHFGYGLWDTTQSAHPVLWLHMRHKRGGSHNTYRSHPTHHLNYHRHSHPSLKIVYGKHPVYFKVCTLRLRVEGGRDVKREELIVLRVKLISGFKHKNQRSCDKDSITLRDVQVVTSVWLQQNFICEDYKLSAVMGVMTLDTVITRGNYLYQSDDLKGTSRR